MAGVAQGRNPASSQGPDQASSQGLDTGFVNAAAQKILSMSMGVMRVPIEELGPALFNRQGSAISGQHCINLGMRIMNVEGFATFRYVAGYCHEPDPADPTAVARHGNSMANTDPTLYSRRHALANAQEW